MSELVETMSQIALNAVENSMPCGVCFGTVSSASPLEILVEQKMTLGASHLILSTLVQDFHVDMTVDHTTENDLGSLDLTHSHTAPLGETSQAGYKDLTHRHDYIGRKTFLVHLGLKAGEKVILLRIQGGQQYIVLDRVR